MQRRKVAGYGGQMLPPGPGQGQGPPPQAPAFGRRRLEGQGGMPGQGPMASPEFLEQGNAGMPGNPMAAINPLNAESYTQGGGQGYTEGGGMAMPDMIRQLLAKYGPAQKRF